MSSGDPPAIEFHPPGADDRAFWQNLAATFRSKFGDMASTPSTATPVRHAFEARVAETKVPKSDINHLILDYLTMEGYTDAAAKFAAEANIPLRQDEHAIKARQEIKTLIHQGDIRKAVEALNGLDPQMLDQDNDLNFALLRLELIELIRSCPEGDKQRTVAAIKFASENLGPRATESPAFLDQLEKTMALFLYPRDQLRPEQQALLHPDLRRDVADKVNKAVVSRQTKRCEAAIRQLVKVRAWSEGEFRKAGKDLPDRLDLGLNGDDAGGSPHQNGSEPMVTI